MRKLTIKEDIFCTELMKQGGAAFGNASEAYRVAFNCKNMKGVTVNRRACDLVKRPHIRAALDKLQTDIAKEAKFTTQDLFRHWVNIVTADVNELVQHRVEACRYCHGKDHMYQWTTETEYAKALELHKRSGATTELECGGGFGYTPNVKPNKKCPECSGKGLSQVYIADTRYMSESAKMLYNGIKRTANGVEIVLRNKDSALESIAKFLGAYKIESPYGGGNAGPMGAGGQGVSKVSEITKDPIEAAKVYNEIMGA